MTLKTATNIAIAGTVLWIISLVLPNIINLVPGLAETVYTSKMGCAILGILTIPLPVTFLIFFVTFQRKLQNKGETIHEN